MPFIGILGQQQPQTNLLELCPDLTLTFFNEQQLSWGFGIQNASADIKSQWQLVIEDANYQLDPSQITNNADFTYQEIDNGDGTYDLIITSTGPLAAFAGTPSYAWNAVDFGFAPTSSNQTLRCESA